MRCAFVALVFLVSTQALAEPNRPEVFGRVEATAAIPLTAPQNERFDVGFQGIADVGLGLGWVDPHLSGLLLALPSKASSASSESSTAGGPGVGVRLNLSARHTLVRPYLDVDAFYVRTATLNRFAWSAALGANFPVGGERAFRFGPVVRFIQITNPDHRAYDDRDAFLLTVGVSAELGIAFSNSSSASK